MKKRKIPLALILGTTLIVIALSMVIASRIRIRIGEDNSREITREILTILPDRSVGIPGKESSANLPILQINGVDYAALLEIPAFGLTVAVSDRWEERDLYDSAARFYGSTHTNTLVIGGGDYDHQFAFCDKIDHGTVVTVTDMTGACFTYRVTEIDRAAHAENQWLISEDCDLTLFCRDTFAMEYIAVRCELAHH